MTMAGVVGFWLVTLGLFLIGWVTFKLARKLLSGVIRQEEKAPALPPGTGKRLWIAFAIVVMLFPIDPRAWMLGVPLYFYLIYAVKKQAGQNSLKSVGSETKGRGSRDSV